MDYLKALKDRTSPDLWTLITRLADLAADRASPLYIVGGRVRDLLLERPATDLDLVVEGDALELVRALAFDQGGEAIVHPRFGTATYRTGTLRFDLATARTESYSRPGVLPDVRPGPIEEDLARRDFTVNAMALRLSPPDTGTLLDRFGSRQDVEDGLIRVLHDGSFVDDPTRIMRAIRYEQRLGFRIEPSTLALLSRDLHLLPSVGVDRLRRELDLFLLEPAPELPLLRADFLGVLRTIDPALHLGARLSEIFQFARRQLGQVEPAIYLALLLYSAETGKAMQFLDRYRFPKESIGVVKGTLALRDSETIISVEGLRNSQVHALFKGFDRDSVSAFGIAAEHEIARARAADYLSRLADVRPELTGKDLINLGMPRGPKIGQVLNRLLDARLDGLTSSREDEAALIKEWLTESGS